MRSHARPHPPLDRAVAHWPARGALVGLDLGTKTIGVAVPTRPPAGDRRRDACTARLQGRRGAAAGIAAERNVVGFVVGLPINMDGSEGPRAQSTRAFARNFANLTGLADRAVGRAAVDGGRRARTDRQDVCRARRAEVIDEHAAIFILQGALDRLAKLRGDR